MDTLEAGSPLHTIAAPLVAWLTGAALPRWATTGVDDSAGGFFEKIDLQGWPVEEPRRARVVARQIYVFATAARRGWWAGADALVDHGLRFLETMRLPHGTYAAAVSLDGTVVDPRFDLYEQAFVLFALATASAGRPEREARLRPQAEALLRVLLRGWRHPLGGFEEAVPRTLPLRANPHMHLLEAALAWAEISDPATQPEWAALADELAGLCLRRFIAADSGALHECFDGDWRTWPGAGGSLVEPGHQFEWAWLLMRWGRRAGRADALAAAERLLAIGEARGVDSARGVAVNALNDALEVTDPLAKVWPQTERIKAWHAACAGLSNPDEAKAAQRTLAYAALGLAQFFLAEPAGLWHEQMNATGGFDEQHCRASSLYHIVCAIDTLMGDGG